MHKHKTKHSAMAFLVMLFAEVQVTVIYFFLVQTKMSWRSLLNSQYSR